MLLGIAPIENDESYEQEASKGVMTTLGGDILQLHIQASLFNCMLRALALAQSCCMGVGW